MQDHFIRFRGQKARCSHEKGVSTICGFNESKAMLIGALDVVEDGMLQYEGWGTKLLVSGPKNDIVADFKNHKFGYRYYSIDDILPHPEED
jgi:hypothetical protein